MEDGEGEALGVEDVAAEGAETHALVEGGGDGVLLVHVDVGDTIFVLVAVWWPRPYMRRFETTSRPISGTSAGK